MRDSKTGDTDAVMTDAGGATPQGRLPPNRRGKQESISSFLARLPPSKTRLDTSDPWIWMRNHSQGIEPGDISTLTRKGIELLRTYVEQSAELRAEHDKSGSKTTAPLTRKLNLLRRELEKNIFALARETGVTTGKWMLFPSVDQVDATWKTVVEAIESGKLGNDAKVATDDGSGQSRLICVYTADFGDTNDVKRVAKAMAELGLIDVDKRPIYYKCDAYTNLDITSKNEYGLKASMFSSRDMLKS